MGYTLVFDALSSAHLHFTIKLTGDKASSLNRVVLAIDSSKEEAIFGCGSQLTYFNQKGKLVPILVQEHGIGRGKPIVTQLVDLLDYDQRWNAFPYWKAGAVHYDEPSSLHVLGELRIQRI